MCRRQWRGPIFFTLGLVVVIVCVRPWAGDDDASDTTPLPSNYWYVALSPSSSRLPLPSNHASVAWSKSPSPSPLLERAAPAAIRVVRCRHAPLSSGFNNQIYMLCGFLKSHCGSPSTGDAVRLPGLRNDLGGAIIHPFADIFDAAAFAESLADVCHIIVDSPDDGSSPPCTPSELQPTLLPQPSVDWHHRVYSALTLSARLASVLHDCQTRRDAALRGASPEEAASPAPPPHIAVHMRVERDWQMQAARMDEGAAAVAAAVTPPWARGGWTRAHSFFFSPAEIAAMVLGAFKSPPGLGIDTGSPLRILVAGAADRMEPAFAAGNASVLGVWAPSGAIVTSSHALGCFNSSGGSSGGPSRLSYTERSALEAFLVLDAAALVGHHVSTFFEGALKMRAARGGAGRAGGYAYSCSGGVGARPGAPLRLLPFHPVSPSGASEAEGQFLFELADCDAPTFPPVPSPPSMRPVAYDRLAFGAEIACARAECSSAGGASSSSRSEGAAAVRACIERRLPGVARGLRCGSARASSSSSPLPVAAPASAAPLTSSGGNRRPAGSGAGSGARRSG